MDENPPCVVVDFSNKKIYIAFYRYQLEDLVKALTDNPDAPTMGLEITFTEAFQSENMELMFK